MISLWGVIKGLLVQEEADRTKQVSLEIDSGATTNTRTTISAAQTADRTLSLPDATDTLVGRDTTDTLTNKTIDGDDNTVQDLALSSLKTEPSITDEFIIRNGLGEVVDDKAVPTGDVVGTSDAQTLENKTIDATAATGNNTLSADASDITFDNVASGLTATDTQAAIDEVEGRLDTAETDIAGKLDNLGAGTDNAVPKTNAAGDAIERSGVLIDDSNNITGVNDLTVNGNLQVDGTTTTVNSATLDVTDSNITVNNNGNDATAEGAGLTVERTGADGSIVYEDALASKFKIGAVGSEVEVADVSSTQSLANKSLDNTNSVTVTDANLTIQDDADNTKQANFELSGLTTATTRTYTMPDDDTSIVGTDVQQVLTNKDIDGGTASDNNRITLPKEARATLDGLTRKEGTIAYDQTNDVVVIDDGTELIEVGSGSGSGTGRFNYIENSQFERNLNGVANYDDGAVSEPVDGTGGTASDLTILLRDTGDFYGDNYLRISKAAATDAQGQGVSIDFRQPISLVDDGSRIEVSFDYQATGDYQTGDVRVFVYNITQATMEGAVINDDEGGIVESTGGSFLGYFTPTGTDEYRLIFHFTGDNSNTNAFNLDIDNIVVGPQLSVPRTIPRHTAPQDGTVVFQNNTASFTTVNAKYWREGNTLRYRGRVDFTSAGSGAGSFRIEIPAEVTTEFGPLTFLTQQYDGNATFYNLDTHINIYRNNSSTFDQANNAWQFIKDESGGVVQGLAIRNLSQFYFDLHVRVQEWEDEQDALISTTSNLLSNILVQSTEHVPLGTLNGGFNAVRYQTFTENLGSSYDTATGIFTAPEDAIYTIDAQISVDDSWANGEALQIQLLTPVGSFTETTRCWNTLTTGITARISKTLRLSQGQTVIVQSLVFGATTPTFGSNCSLSISSKSDLTIFTVFGQTELYESAVATTAWGLGTNVWGDLTSITLPPGEYDFFYNAFVNNNTGGGATWSIGIDTTSGNVAPSGSNGVDLFDLSLGSGSSGTLSMSKPGIVVTNTTTFYAKLKFNTTLGVAGGRLWARKVK